MHQKWWPDLVFSKEETEDILKIGVEEYCQNSLFNCSVKGKTKLLADGKYLVCKSCTGNTKFEVNSG